jgi:hypothetical protein
MYDHGQKKYIRDDVRHKPKAEAVSTAERRDGDRHLVTASAEVVELGSGVRYSTRTTDLSAGGCFVDTLTPFHVGARVHVRVDGGKTRFEAQGTVVYAQTGLGMGIAFDELTPEQASALHSWIEQPHAHSHAPDPAPDRPKAQPIMQTSASERAILIRLVRLLARKGVLSEEEITALFNNDSIVL